MKSYTKKTIGATAHKKILKICKFTKQEHKNWFKRLHKGFWYTEITLTQIWYGKFNKS